jgi:putative colanic acid biosynthesis UDP-glucose lipid carrier transferase
MLRRVLKPHASLFYSALRASDPLSAVVVGLATYRIYLGAWLPPEHYLLLLVAAAISIIALFPAFRLYEPQRGASLADESRQLLLAWGLLAALVGGTIFATKSGIAFSRVWVAAWLIASFVVTLALRLSTRVVLRQLRKHGHNLRHVVIVGAGGLGRAIAELATATWTGLQVIGYYDDDPATHGAKIAGRPVLGAIDRLAGDVVPTGIDQVWIALPLRAEERIRDILTALRDQSVDVRFVPDIYSFHLLNHSLTEVAGLPVISLTETPIAGANRVIKAIEDYALAVAALLVAAPLMLAVATGVKLSSPGPVLYRQERVTWNGRRFDMLKFRTMPIDAESQSGPVWTRRGGNARRRSERSLGDSASMNCRSSSTSFAETCRSWVRDRSAPNSSPNSASEFPVTCKSIWSRPASQDGLRSTTCAATATWSSGYNTICTTSSIGRSGSTFGFSR